MFATFASCLASAAAYSNLSIVPVNELFMNISGFKLAGLLVYFLFPRASFLDSISSSLLIGDDIIVNVWGQLVHLILISGLYVWLASYFVKRKDF